MRAFYWPADVQFDEVAEECVARFVGKVWDESTSVTFFEVFVPILADDTQIDLRKKIVDAIAVQLSIPKDDVISLSL